jgi:hypothetical protein
MQPVFHYCSQRSPLLDFIQNQTNPVERCSDDVRKWKLERSEEEAQARGFK